MNKAHLLEKHTPCMHAGVIGCSGYTEKKQYYLLDCLG